MLRKNFTFVLSVFIALFWISTLAAPLHAYIDLAPTLAKVISDSRKIALVEVVEYNREKHEVAMKEVRVLKGDASTDLVRHEVASTDKGAVPQQIQLWALPGSRAVLFASRNTSLVCIGPGWYQARTTGSGPWKLGVDRPDLSLSYYGSLSRLTDSIESMIAGKTAVLTVVAYNADNEGAAFDLALNRQSLPGLVRLQRIRANMQMPQMVMAASSNPAYFLGPGVVDVDDIPALIDKLKSSEPMDRAEAADDLRSLGRKAAEAASPLAALLKDSQQRVRFSAASALLQITPKDARPIEVLTTGLSDADATTRRDAALAAGLAGSAAAPLAEKLADLLKDKNQSVKNTALQAISTLGPAAAKAAGSVTPLLDDPELTIDAADALGRIGPAARPALKRLAQMLSSDQPAVQWAAVRAMSQIGGEEARPAADFMVRALRTASEIESYHMMVYFALLGPVAKDSAAAIRGVRIKNPLLPQVTLWAIEADKSLPWQGQGGMFNMPGPGMADTPDIALYIYEAFVHELGERLRPTAKLLAQKIMDGTAGNVPAWGYQILTCGPEEAIAVLAPRLADQDLVMRQRATVALGRMGAAAAPAKVQIKEALDKAANEKEKRLLQWCLDEISGEQ
jgi:HEAT repeat protein